ncbi:Hypothetical predicted protein, partial [Marmota monax]
ELRPFFLLRLLHQLPEERLPRLPAAIVYFLSRHLTSLFSWNNTGVTSNGCRGRDTGARSDGCRGRTLGSRATAAKDGTLGPGAMAAEDGHWGQEQWLPRTDTGARSDDEQWLLRTDTGARSDGC